MKCCIDCFLDAEIRSIIAGQGQLGDCNFCNSCDVFIYDTHDSQHLLSELIYGLLSIYTTRENLPSDFPNSKMDLLKNILHREWDIFKLQPDKIYNLLREICRDQYIEYPELFDSVVGLPQACDKEYLALNSLLKDYSWDSFLRAIKTENRFHSNHINLDVLGLFVDYAKIHYKAGERFYRARISSDNRGFLPDAMGAPPFKLAKSGRVNSEGISVLYLADSIDTVVYEVRAGRYDYISIGEFVLLNDIAVVSLDSMKTISPFMRDGDFAQHAVNRDPLSRLAQEVARPMRRYDSNLDYLPTQYLSDFIKSKEGISGITYRSSMSTHGLNLAAFFPDQFECVNVKVLEVTGLQYTWEYI